MAKNKTLAQANRRRRARRLWDNLVKKLSSYPNLYSQKPMPLEEDAWDRHERHMKPIRQAQQRVVKLSDEHIRQQIEGGG